MNEDLSKERKTKAKNEVYGCLLGNNLHYNECCEVLKDLVIHFDFLDKKCSSYTIPSYTLSAEEVSKQLRINCDCIKKEITDHIDSELRRFYVELTAIKKGHFS